MSEAKYESEYEYGHSMSRPSDCFSSKSQHYCDMRLLFVVVCARDSDDTCGVVERNEQ